MVDLPTRGLFRSNGVCSISRLRAAAHQRQLFWSLQEQSQTIQSEASQSAVRTSLGSRLLRSDFMKESFNHLQNKETLRK